MAEFVKTMEEARRLCATQENCEKCPIWYARLEVCRIGAAFNDDKIVDTITEGIILSWAKEHPEPVYPTWKEGWKQLFPEADIRHTLCPEVFGDKYKCDWCHDDNDNCDECLERPMPAEVAEKLGIKPIAPEKPPKHDCDTCKFERRKGTDEPCVRCKHCIDCEESILTAPDLWEEQ